MQILPCQTARAPRGSARGSRRPAGPKGLGEAPLEIAQLPWRAAGGCRRRHPAERTARAASASVRRLARRVLPPRANRPWPRAAVPGAAEPAHNQGSLWSVPQVERELLRSSLAQAPAVPQTAPLQRRHRSRASSHGDQAKRSPNYELAQNRGHNRVQSRTPQCTAGPIPRPPSLAGEPTRSRPARRSCHVGLRLDGWFHSMLPKRYPAVDRTYVVTCKVRSEGRPDEFDLDDWLAEFQYRSTRLCVLAALPEKPSRSVTAGPIGGHLWSWDRSAQSRQRTSTSWSCPIGFTHPSLHSL